MKLSTLLLTSGVLIGSMAGTISCKKNNNNNNNMNNGGQQTPPSVKTDFSNIFGLMVMDNSSTGTASLIDEHNKTVDRLNLDAPKFEGLESEDGSMNLTEVARTGQARLSNGEKFTFVPEGKKLGLMDDGTTNQMTKLDSSGNATSAFASVDPNAGSGNMMGPPQQPMPGISTIGVSPTLDRIYFQFANKFLYKTVAPKDMQLANQPNSPYQCQVFSGSFSDLDSAKSGTLDETGITCVDPAHTINSWQAHNNLFQFDAAGDVYYPAQVGQTGQSIVYKVTPNADKTFTETELINANICVQDYLITSSGGAFYTGATCTSGGGSPGSSQGGFFRYISPTGTLTDIARDWWNFIYNADVTATRDQAVFFGPDPRISSTASMDSACLFKFDPAGADVASRISDVITCGSDIWGWMNMTRDIDVNAFGYGSMNPPPGNSQNFTPSVAWKTEFKNRCTTSARVFAGGGSQINSIKQTSTGDIYVIGNIRKKLAGTANCSLQVRGPHCTVGGVPMALDSNSVSYTATTCKSNQGTWVNSGRCNNGGTDSTCITDAITQGRNWDPNTCHYNGTTDTTVRTAAGCTATNYVWAPPSGQGWQGLCNSSNPTSTTDANQSLAKAYDNNKNSCLPIWQPTSINYNNVESDMCFQAQTGDMATWWSMNGSDPNGQYGVTASAGQNLAYSAITTKFVANGYGCTANTTSAGTNSNWTEEYASLAKVDPNTNSLQLISLPTEKAIKLWVANDKPYYSSYDTVAGNYLLSAVNASAPICIDESYTTQATCEAKSLTWSDRKCLRSTYTKQSTCEQAGYAWFALYPQELQSKFETYNLAEGGSDATKLTLDGLDFTNNTYKVGSLDVSAGIITTHADVTGKVKTIVIMPKAK